MTLCIRATPQPQTSTCISNPTLSNTTTPSLAFNKSQIGWDGLKNESQQCNSPKLGHRWRQYQGINNWEGLLDPLDNNLRMEILRYGQFVESAYRAFDFDTNSPTYATCLYKKASLLARTGMSKSGYRVTRNLHATCGVQLPSWVSSVSQLPRVQSSWIGYVAVCEDKEEIARLGRRDVVIALRGTATSLEWLENLRVTLTKLPACGSGSQDCMVENGFLSLYVSKTGTCPSLQDMLRQELATLIQAYAHEPLSITITGHSLGAALALLSAYDITTAFKNAPMVTVLSFAGPRVGNDKFRSQLENTGTRILRIVNSDDVITKVPGLVVPDHDVPCNRGVYVAGFHTWFRRLVQDMQLVYADIGQELRVSSRESPYLKKGDVATCHDLKTYLHLVHGFVSSSSPYMTKTLQYPWS
ncbi:hypothetical protein VNO78_15103 [Psophocarpus tetragonolobus]|uniref:Fungal lipase-type domain-containing protein n=1 Tax=Psophocarpus tetragonolobus TaxID=3891 RepID=A0AAN9XIW5_PSOTE